MDRLNTVRRPVPPANAGVDEVLRYLGEVRDAVRAGWTRPAAS